MSRQELKQKARESLTGKYGEAFIVMLLFSILTSVATNIGGAIATYIEFGSESYEIYGTTITLSYMSEIISLIISSLLSFGYLNFFLKISRNENAEINDLWSKINMFFPYLGVSILIGLFTSLWSLLFIIPGIIASFSYSMTYYIMLDNPNMSCLDAIKESKRIMKGHKWDYFVLNLSFIGWILLGIFTLGILYIWLVPYIAVTECNFYNEIKKA